ncbi:MAG: dephospho-CoA kinase [Candidatus Marinimicrobia bacterium]|nr:dephospho-CoA kinase [Candidatus Neomarinimicrobiota bacterium]
MKKIGLTGGLGSGKSAALKYFYALGANVLSADDIAKQLLKSNAVLMAKVREYFGHECYENGELQTAVLASRAFCSPEKQQQLNAIVHPSLREYLEKYLQASSAIPGVMVVEAALLFEAGYEDLFDLNILIVADEAVRIQRAAARNFLSPEDIRRRISLQFPDEKKRGKADIVIENNGSEGELQEACRKIWESHIRIS